MKYCVNCGNQLPDDANFCSKCGKQVTSNVASSQTTTSTGQSRPVWDREKGTSTGQSRLVWDREKGTYTGQRLLWDRKTGTYKQNPNYSPQQRYYKTSSNTNASLHGGGLGFVLTFFFGLIGFILCLCLGDDDCKSAAKATFWVTLIIAVFIGIILGVAGSCAAEDYYAFKAIIR